MSSFRACSTSTSCCYHPWTSSPANAHVLMPGAVPQQRYLSSPCPSGPSVMGSYSASPPEGGVEMYAWTAQISSTHTMPRRLTEVLLEVDPTSHIVHHRHTEHPQRSQRSHTPRRGRRAPQGLRFPRLVGCRFCSLCSRCILRVDAPSRLPALYNARPQESPCPCVCEVAVNGRAMPPNAIPTRRTRRAIPFYV